MNSMGLILNLNSNMVNEVISTISSLFIHLLFFSRKGFKHTKTQIKQRSTNKTKISEQKTAIFRQIEGRMFCAEKLQRGGKSLVLRFGASCAFKIFS